MPNNTRTQADGVWVDGYTPPPSDWEDLERKIFGSWNGDRGGAYARGFGSNAYTISGSGLQVIGPTRLTYGGSVRGGAGRFVIRDGAWPELAVGHIGRLRSIVCPIATWQLAPSNATQLAGSFPSRQYLWSTNHPYAGVGSVALACRQTNSRTIETAPIYIPVRVIDGAVLTKLTVFFRVVSKRSLAPIAMPKFRILRVPRDSGDASQTTLPEPLKATVDGSGFDFLPLVTSPDTWWNNGEVQSFEYICDQNNVVDTERYHYVAHLIEEQGAISADDQFDGIRFVERKLDAFLVAPNSTTLNNSQTVDGQSTSNTGARVLVVDTDEQLAMNEPTLASAKNGIWRASAVDWTRAEDADDSDDFTPGWIIRVNSGGVNANSTWQCAYPSNVQRINLTSPSSGGVGASSTHTPPRIQPAVPKGNIWHALVPTFEVRDLRFQ